MKEVAERCGMPYCNERWLGGTLTNLRTIRGSGYMFVPGAH